ncbi:PKD domain-containing protein [Candidatus Peregrinibacteria bacterium]|nr:PKD domain-containing protein [Candidatus Peregrinibacteria bacterium]
MKSILVAFFIVLSALTFPSFAGAMGFNKTLQPTITANEIVRVNNNIIFDASSSFILDNQIAPQFRWDFGDGTYERGGNVVHAYSKPGQYLVKLTLVQGKESASLMREVFVYQKLAVLITDMADMKDRIMTLTSEARKEGTAIEVIDSYDSATAFMAEESFTKKLTERGDALSHADFIISWTASGAGINALSHLIRGENETLAAKIRESIQDKTIVLITDKNLKSLARTLQVHFNIIRPKQIILTREHELTNLIAAETPSAFTEHLKGSLSDYRIIDEETGRISLLNSISYLVNFMIIKGIPTNTIVLLLMLPIIATLIAFFKQVIGITTFGLYLPSIITLSFLALGLKFGLTILIILTITGVLLRKALDRLPLLHIPRMAIILTISTFIILLMLAAGTILGINQLATLAVFPMLIMTSLAEKFVNVVSERGILGALVLMFEIIAVSLLCYSVVEWQFLQTLILGYPELILGLIIIHYFLGRWTGLRLMEYLRFKTVMKYTEEE